MGIMRVQSCGGLRSGAAGAEGGWGSGGGGGFWRGLGGRRDDFHGDLRGEEAFEAALEGALDHLVDGAAAAGADEDLLNAVQGGGFGDELGTVGAGVVHGDDGDPDVVGELEVSGEGALGGD